MRTLIPAVLVAAAMAVAFPTAAMAAQQTGTSSSTGKTQAPPKPKKPPVPRKPLGLRAYFVFDTEIMAASQTFKAVTDSSTMFGYGGGGEILNLWRNVFARVGWTTQSKTGERVEVVDDGTIIKPGFPVDLKLNTFEVGGGWREYMKKHPNIAMYAGGSVLFVKYSQKSEFAPEENIEERFSGYSAQGGLEFALSKMVIAGVEGQYRIVPDGLGQSGPSKHYNETDLGGIAIRGMIGIRFKK